MARTQEQRKADTRERLLRAGADLFARKGFHATSADAVADAADRTTGALYAHFGNKEGLLTALLDDWRRSTIAEVSAELSTDAADVDAGLGTLWSRFAPTADDDRAAWQLLEHELWLYAARTPDAASPVAKRYRDWRAKLGLGIAQWDAADGHDDELPVDERATLAFALLLGLAMQRRLDRRAVPDRLAVAGLRRLLGYRPRP